MTPTLKTFCLLAAFLMVPFNTEAALVFENRPVIGIVRAEPMVLPNLSKVWSKWIEELKQAPFKDTKLTIEEFDNDNVIQVRTNKLSPLRLR